MPDMQQAAVTLAAPVAWRPVELTGWGRGVRAPALAARPERQRDLLASLHPPEGRTLIAHGNGRSYGDAALNTAGAALLTRRLDRLLAFDPTTGVLVAEPGVTFAELLEVFLPRGWVAPVSPGTGFVTLGGALANDVHGKNHHRDGSFAEHVPWFDLILADGTLRRVSPESDPALFCATAGGIGLTGIIAAVALRLQPVPSNALAVTRRRVRNLEEFLAGFAAAAEAPYSVGWIDAQATGASLGRGILETAAPAAESIPTPPARPRRFPLEAPGWLLNRASVAAFNAAYWRGAPLGGRQAVVPYGRFLYPLDAILDWNRMYGRRGFRQFQCVVPPGPGEAALRMLLAAVAAAGAASFLAVLKVMGRPGIGMLSFAAPGYSLALDIPARAGSATLFAQLERITRDAGGRIYLAKDSTLSAAGFAAMYPEAPALQAVRDRVDPGRRFSSDMARRLGLT